MSDEEILALIPKDDFRLPDGRSLDPATFIAEAREASRVGYFSFNSEVGTESRETWHSGCQGWKMAAPLVRCQRSHERRMDSARLSRLLRWGFVRLFRSLGPFETRLKLSHEAGGGTGTGTQVLIWRSD